MKYFILIFSFISQYGFSQNNYNFTTQNNQIEWQKVLEINMTRNEIESILKSNGIFKNVNFSENSITGEIENLNADYKGAGISSFYTFFYIQNTTISGHFIIDFKQGKYRTLLNAINLKTSNDLSGGGINIMSANAVQPLSYYALKNSQIRKGFLNSDAKIYDYTFSNLFDNSLSKFLIKSIVIFIILECDISVIFPSFHSIVDNVIIRALDEDNKA